MTAPKSRVDVSLYQKKTADSIHGFRHRSCRDGDVLRPQQLDEPSAQVLTIPQDENRHDEDNCDDGDRLEQRTYGLFESLEGRESAGHHSH